MLTIRPEVKTYIRVTQVLLSDMLPTPLNQDEWGLVALCAQKMADRYPVSAIE